MILLLGAVLGLVSAAGLSLSGMARDRASLAVIVIAVASYWPIFAAEHSQDFWLHLAGLTAFAAVALLGFWRMPALLGIALLAHGIFDLWLATTDHPAPNWWPQFCAAFDATLGLWWLWHIRRTKPHHG